MRKLGRELGVDAARRDAPQRDPFAELAGVLSQTRTWRCDVDGRRVAPLSPA